MNQVILAINILSRTVDHAMVLEDQFTNNKIEVGLSEGAHEENCDRQQSSELGNGLSAGMQRVISPNPLYCGSGESPQHYL